MVNKFYYKTLLAVIFAATTAFTSLNAEKISPEELLWLNELRVNATDKLKALVGAPWIDSEQIRIKNTQLMREVGGTSIKDRATYGIEKFQAPFTENDGTKLWTAQIRGATRETRDLLRHLWNLDTFDTISLSPNAQEFEKQYKTAIKDIEDSYNAASSNAKNDAVSFDILEKALNAIVTGATLLSENVQSKIAKKSPPQSPRGDKVLRSQELASLNRLRETAVLKLREILTQSWILNKDIPAKNPQLMLGYGTSIKDRIAYAVEKLEKPFTESVCTELWKMRIRGAIRETKDLLHHLWNLDTFDSVVLNPNTENFKKQYAKVVKTADDMFRGGKLEVCSVAHLDDTLVAIAEAATLLSKVQDKAEQQKASNDELSVQAPLLEELNALRLEVLPKIESLMKKNWINDRKIGELSVTLSPILGTPLAQRLAKIHDEYLAKEFAPVAQKEGKSWCSQLFSQRIQKPVGSMHSLMGSLHGVFHKIDTITLPNDFIANSKKIEDTIEKEIYSAFEPKTCSPDSLKKLMLLLSDATDLLLDISPAQEKVVGFAKEAKQWLNAGAEDDASLLALFGLSGNATKDDLKQAYRKRVSLYWHPDKYKGEENATEVIQKINTIYDRLLPRLKD